MEKFTQKQLDRWFNQLDSNKLRFIFPEVFDEVMSSADPEHCTINDFIDDADEKWNNLSFEEKIFIYSQVGSIVGEIEDNEDKPSWDFVYDEEIPVIGMDYCQLGVLSNGKHFLFYRVTDDMCYIYSSMNALYDGDDDSMEVKYKWTAENDSLVVDKLNSLPEDSDAWCGENCVLRSIEFNNSEE